ncbi:MAG: glycosyltransferase [Alphaproteobacteria bacterium]
MKVAHVVCPDGMYGAERWILMLGRHLSRRGVPLVLVTIGDSEGARDVHRRFEATGVPCVRLPHDAKISPGAISGLRRVVREHGVDVLHTHEFKSDVFGWLATRGLPVSLVSTPHGWSSGEGLRIAAYEVVDRAFLRGFDGLYPLSLSLEADLLARGYPRERVHLVENAVDDEPFEDCWRAREAAGFPASGRVVFVGRVLEPKGVMELADAAARLRDLPDFRLVIAGRGAAEEALRARVAALGIADRVEFAGYVEDVPGLLRDADAIVLPSHSEGLPRVLMEAAAAGVAIVGTDIPGIRDLVANGESGLLVPVRDPEALADAIRRVSSDAGLRTGLLRRARARLLERHTGARLARDFEAAYAALC